MGADYQQEQVERDRLNYDTTRTSPDQYTHAETG